MPEILQRLSKPQRIRYSSSCVLGAHSDVVRLSWQGRCLLAGCLLSSWSQCEGREVQNCIAFFPSPQLFNMSAWFSPMVWTTPVNKPMSSCMQEPCHMSSCMQEPCHIPKTACHMTLPHSPAPSSSHPLPAACRGEGWWRCSIHAWVPTLSILGTLVGYGSVHRTSLSVLRTFYNRSWEQHKPMDESINIYKALWQHDHLANHQ